MRLASPIPVALLVLVILRPASALAHDHAHPPSGVSWKQDDADVHPAYRDQDGGALRPSYPVHAQECCQPQPMMLVMVPVAQAQTFPSSTQSHCTETVEYVYEDVPVAPRPARRHIPRRSKGVPDKRVRLR